MNEVQCKFCGGQLERIPDGFICRDCGKRAVGVDLEDWVTENENEPLSKTTEKKRSGKKLIIIIACILCACAMFSFVYLGFNNGSDKPLVNLKSSSKIQKIIERNGYGNYIDVDSVTEVLKKDLESGADGYSLVLLNDGMQYTLALVNFSEDKMQLFDYGEYFPLVLIVDNYISRLSESKQILHAECLAKYINEYGINCFDNRDAAEAYIKELGGVCYDVYEARTLIENSALSQIPNSQNIADFKVIFDNRTAVPLYYAFMTETLTRNPNWGYIDVNTLNAIQVDFFTQRFGPLYVEEETWHAYSRDFNLMDSSFKKSSYEALEEALLRTHEIVYGN